jgi:hypothetical protein
MGQIIRKWMANGNIIRFHFPELEGPRGSDCCLQLLLNNLVIVEKAGF